MTIVGAAGAETLPLQTKARVAAAILDRVEALLGSSRGAPEALLMDREQLVEHLSSPPSSASTA